MDDGVTGLEQLRFRLVDNGLRMIGKHHEIYFSDSRKVAPEKLRTILRQPVTSAAASEEVALGDPMHQT